MSIDYSMSPAQHYALAKELAVLRKKGVLIIGSGNNVHNLRMVSWQHLNSVGYAFDWAQEANERMKAYIKDGNHQPLIDFQNQGSAFPISDSTPEHYLPMIYALALQEKNEPLQIFNDAAVAGSLCMTSLKIG